MFGKVVPQRPVKITSFDGTTEHVHWVGWIEAIQPEVNAKGKILASGAMQFYKAAETQLELQENKRTDEIIAELLKEVVLPPALNRAWSLGRSGNSEVGETMYFADTTSYSDLEQGRLTLGMAAPFIGAPGRPVAEATACMPMPLSTSPSTISSALT